MIDSQGQEKDRLDSPSNRYSESALLELILNNDSCRGGQKLQINFKC